MSNPTLESTIHEILDLKRMREELDAAITALEDSIKAVMGDEEILTAGAYKVSWKTFTSSRVDTTALKKALPEIAAAYTKTTTARRFSIRRAQSPGGHALRHLSADVPRNLPGAGYLRQVYQPRLPRFLCHLAEGERR